MRLYKYLKAVSPTKHIVFFFPSKFTMRLSLLFTIFASFAAVSLGEVLTVTTSDLSIGESTVGDGGNTVIPVVDMVDGKPVTYHFSVVDGTTVYVADNVKNGLTNNFAKQEAKEAEELESYLQEVIEAAEHQNKESASYKPKPSMSLSEAVKKVAHSSSI